MSLVTKPHEAGLDSLTFQSRLYPTFPYAPQGDAKLAFDGTKWVASYGDAFTGLRSVLHDVGGEVFHVAAYNAVADGTGDQLASLQAAVNDAKRSGGGIVQLGRGTYRNTATWTIDNTTDLGNKVIIRGVGQYGTTVYLDSATATALYFDGSAGGLSGVAVEDLSIVCFASGTNTRTAGVGIYLKAVGNYVIRDVAIRSGWNALYLDGAMSGHVENVFIDPAFSGQVNDGVTVTNTSIGNTFINTTVQCSNYAFNVDTGTDTLVFLKCAAQRTAGADTKYGFYFHNSGAAHDPQWVYLSCCYVETSNTGGIGYYFNKCHDVELDSCYSCWGDNALYFNQTATHDIRVIGGNFMLAGQYALVATNATDVLISGATFSNNGWDSLPAVTYDALYLADGTKNWRIKGCRVGHSLWGAAPPVANPAKSQRYAINLVTGGNSTNVLIEGNDLTDNVTGPILYGATLSGTIHVTGNAGCAAGFTAKRTPSAATSVASAVFTAIDLQNAPWDRGGISAGGTGTGNSITIPTGGAGLWAFKGSVGWAANATGYRSCNIYKNGASLAGSQIPNAGAADAVVVECVIYDMAADGDVYVLRGSQNSGGNLNALGNATTTIFEGFKVW